MTPDDILHSLDGAARPVPSPFLYQQVRHRLKRRRQEAADTRLSGKWALRLTVVVLMLVAADVGVWLRYATPARPDAPAAIATDYAYPSTDYAY